MGPPNQLSFAQQGSWGGIEQSALLSRAYMANFGNILEAFVSYDRHTGRPRGFGFVVFEDPAVADKVVSLQHTIDRREVSKSIS